MVPTQRGTFLRGSCVSTGQRDQQQPGAEKLAPKTGPRHRTTQSQPPCFSGLEGQWPMANQCNQQHHAGGQTQTSSTWEALLRQEGLVRKKSCVRATGELGPAAGSLEPLLIHGQAKEPPEKRNHPRDPWNERGISPVQEIPFSHCP